MAQQAGTAQSTPLGAAVQKALETNPSVTASFHALKAALEDVNVASAANLPRLGLKADALLSGNRATAQYNSKWARSGGLSATLSASQLLWDGSVRNDVIRAGHGKLQKYFEFFQASEDAAFEAARAYIDVARYRQLVQLAQDNYNQHKYAFDQTTSRAKAGVGRGVDAEQAAARLALAESNLVTERANLHDVSERYRRVIGELPPADMPIPAQMGRQLPASAGAMLQATALSSPNVAAAIENVRAVRAQVASAESGNAPTLSLIGQAGGSATKYQNADQITNLSNGITSGVNKSANVQGGVELNWNLLNPTSTANARKYSQLLNQAMDLRDSACRDARQNASVAYNDVLKLRQQLAYLDNNVQAITRARNAYRQQFDIGQRSLLDLLNGENELYTARREFANAQFDLDAAQLKAYASMGRLVNALNVNRLNTAGWVDEVNTWTAGQDAATRCPIDANPAGLDSAAKDPVMVNTAGPTPVPTTPLPTSPAPAVAGNAAVEQAARDWAAAWSSKNFASYAGFYATNFVPAGSSKAAWANQRRAALSKPGNITVTLNSLTSRALPNNLVETSFEQRYSSSNYNDSTRKVLVWVQQNGQWKILRESNR
ncbi:TolC family outer membrane protein [Amphibiibacter pelophylacis]|uniref:TolC family outer membrane protein n=1 Tax=Amphibiibacter pelophylacis TaxID=1799477 RepID=A0ACC6P2D5_9BURK